MAPRQARILRVLHGFDLGLYEKCLQVRRSTEASMLRAEKAKMNSLKSLKKLARGQCWAIWASAPHRRGPAFTSIYVFHRIRSSILSNYRTIELSIDYNYFDSY